MTGPMLILIFLASLAILFGLIIKLKWEPFVAMLVVSVGMALFSGIPITEVIQTITSGFGSVLSSIGILIALGVMFGDLLSRSGAINKIAHSMIRAFGIKHTPIAMSLTGAVVSIPVFFDAAFVILIKLVKNISQKTKRPVIIFVTALATGLLVAHCMIPPTPGPLIVAENLQLNLGLFIIYSIIVAVPAVLAGGWWFGQKTGELKNLSPNAYVAKPSENEVEETTEEDSIHTGLAYFLILLPILLILANTVASIVAPGTNAAIVLGFIGEKNMALLISLCVTSICTKRFIKEGLNKCFSKSLESISVIFLVTGIGGSFGAVITKTGIADYLIELMQQFNIPLIVLGFLLAHVIRTSLASATVALVTTSSMLAPVVANSPGTSPMLMAIAICAGSVAISLPNDSAFWVVTKFTDIEVKDTLRTWTIAGMIACYTAFAIILLLNLCSNFLPGL